AAPPDPRAAQTARQIGSRRRPSRCDLRSGGSDRAGPPHRLAFSCAAEKIVLRRACATETFFRAVGFFKTDRRSLHQRFSHLAKRPRHTAADSRQPLCLGGGAVWGLNPSCEASSRSAV